MKIIDQKSSKKQGELAICNYIFNSYNSKLTAF